MEPISEPTLTNYQQVTVEVPEERLAEFHAFFARFLAARGRRGRRGEYRRHAHGRRHGCAHRYRDKVYRFLVNGQTGEVVGRAPWSILKITLTVIVLAVIAFALYYFFGRNR